MHVVGLRRYSDVMLDLMASGTDFDSLDPVMLRAALAHARINRLAKVDSVQNLQDAAQTYTHLYHGSPEKCATNG
eukprot:scaffold234289_cov37-Tisochrysis_lutea.AAC.2